MKQLIKQLRIQQEIIRMKREARTSKKEKQTGVDGKGLFVRSCQSRITLGAYATGIRQSSAREWAKIHTGMGVMRGRMTRPRFREPSPLLNYSGRFPRARRMDRRDVLKSPARVGRL